MDKENLEHTFNVLQNICNELYKEYGLTDNILTLQTAINGLRNEHDVTDKSELVFENYVQ